MASVGSGPDRPWSGKPPVLELKAVIARVPLMPISQSLSARHTAAGEAFDIRRGTQLQMGEAVADRPGRHGLQPQALHRLVWCRRAAR